MELKNYQKQTLRKLAAFLTGGMTTKTFPIDKLCFMFYTTFIKKS